MSSAPMRWLTAIARTPCCRGDLGGDVGQRLLRRGVCRVLQPRHRATAVVVADHAGETHHRPGGFMCDERFVFGQLDRLVGEFGAQRRTVIEDDPFRPS